MSAEERLADLKEQFEAIDSKEEIHGEELFKATCLMHQIKKDTAFPMRFMHCLNMLIGRRPEMTLHSSDKAWRYHCLLVMCHRPDDGDVDAPKCWDWTVRNIKKLEGYVGEIYDDTAPRHLSLGDGEYVDWKVVKHVLKTKGAAKGSNSRAVH